MIGLFDSGNGGLTIYSALARRFPNSTFIYLGDHANAPYGNQSSEEIIELTKNGVETLYQKGCKLVILACNTATAVAARTLQQNWLPNSPWQDHNILGIIAPTVEAATQTPWAVTTPQYPQKYNDDLIAIFATTRTVQSDVYPEEIRKRCPKVEIVQQDCPNLAGAIEAGNPQEHLESLVKEYIRQMLEKTEQRTPHRVILGCTHYPLVEKIFTQYLPQSTRILSQPNIVSDSLEDYLTRHTHYNVQNSINVSEFLTTGKLDEIQAPLYPLGYQDISFKEIAHIFGKT